MSDREWMEFDNRFKALIDDFCLITTYNKLLKEICESASLEQLDAAMIGEHAELQAKAKVAWKAWLDEHISIFNAKNRGELHNYLSLLEHDHVDSYKPALKSMLPISAITSLSARRRLPFKEAIYDLLIIDDLGTEMPNAFTRSQLFSILSERALRQKHIIISTNFTLEEIRTTYGDRVFSRLCENFEICLLTGKDIRSQKKLELQAADSINN
mgnify:CR=1 FL=1